MGIVRILKPGLFLYECVRILLTIYIMISLLPGMSSLPFLFLTAPFVLFPLMALFIWLDVLKYKTYLPLYLAGKCVGAFVLAGWIIIGSSSPVFMQIRAVLFSGDFMTIAAVILIMRSVQNNPVETPKVEDK
jgi:hypothetical protein